MNDHLSALKTCPLFADVAPADLQEMLRCLGASTLDARKNQIIFDEGDPAGDICVVLSGSVHILQQDYYGRRAIVAVAVPGDLFAETFACADLETLPVSAVAAADARILRLNYRRALSVCGSACAFHSRLSANLLREVARKNLLLRERMELLSKRTTREKLMCYLLSEAKKQHSSSFTIPYDRQALADLLCVERSAMSAELSKLRREGVLETTRSHFRLL